MGVGQYKRDCACFLKGAFPPPNASAGTRPCDISTSREKDSIYWTSLDLWQQLVVPYTPTPVPQFSFSLSLASSFCPLSVISSSHLQVMDCWNKACRVVWYLTSFLSQSHPLGSYQNPPYIGSGHFYWRHRQDPSRRECRAFFLWCAL